MGNVTIGGHTYDEEQVRAAVEGILDTTDGSPVDGEEQEDVTEITLPDGQVLRVAGAAQILATDGAVEIHGRTAAMPMAAGQLTQPMPPDGATSMTMQEPGNADQSANDDLGDRMDACEGAVQDLQAQMQGVLQFIQAVTQGNVASALAALDAEDEARVAAALGALDANEDALHELDNGICVTCARLAAANPKMPYGDVTYADTGYQDDKKKRYPLDTRAHVRNALSRIGDPTNSGKYNAGDLAKVKAAMRSAAKKFGIHVADDSKAAA